MQAALWVVVNSQKALRSLEAIHTGRPVNLVAIDRTQFEGLLSSIVSPPLSAAI
jgi:hypothetical protein